MDCEAGDIFRTVLLPPNDETCFLLRFQCHLNGGYAATRVRAKIIQHVFKADECGLDEKQSAQLRLICRHLHVYEQVRYSMTQTARSELQIYKGMGFGLWNRTSRSTDWRITHGWSHFRNGCALRIVSEDGVRQAFQDHGYRIQLETDYCILYQKYTE
jgi:hypothetical protein